MRELIDIELNDVPIEYKFKELDTTITEKINIKEYNKNARFPYALAISTENIIKARDIEKSNDIYMIRYYKEDGTLDVTDALLDKYNKTSSFISNKEIDPYGYNKYIAVNLLKESILKYKKITLPEKIIPVNGLNDGLKISDKLEFKAKHIEIIRNNKMCLHNSAGKSITVCIVVTQDEYKKEKDEAINSNQDTIIYNLYDLIPKNRIISYSLDTKINNIIEKGQYKKHDDRTLSWGYNSDIEKFKNWFSSLVTFELVKTTFKEDRDGRWYFWADNPIKLDKMTKCKYLSSLTAKDKKDKKQHNYLTEFDCKGCSRKLFDTWNGKYGILVCNHSNDVDNSDILRIIYGTNNL